MRRVLLDVDGGQVWVDERVGTGVPVLLLPPGWGDSSIWDDVVARLPASSRVIRVDARGYGRSPAPRAPFTELADLTAVLDALEVDQAVVAGHSGGGATAVSLALARPERVLALVLAAPGVEGYPWPAQDPFLTGYQSLLEQYDVEGLLELGVRTWARSGDDPAARSQLRRGLSGQLAQGEHVRPADPRAFARSPWCWGSRNTRWSPTACARWPAGSATAR